MKRFGLSLIALLVLCASASAANRFAVCTTTCTWDNVSTAMWSTSTGGATGASAPTIADAVILDAGTCAGGTTCTITPNATISVASLTLGACTASTTGCILDFSANNNNITFAGNLSLTGTGTRTLKMGNGNWTFGLSAGSMITVGTTTNLTLTPGSSTIITNHTNGGGTIVTFNPGALTWGNLTINGNSSKGTLALTGSAIFSNIIFNGPNYIDFAGGGTTSMNTLTVSGTPTNVVSLHFAQLSISTFPITASWAYLRGAICNSSSAVFTSSIDGGENTLCQFTTPVTGTTACILGGWLLWRDMPKHINDNFPAWLDKAA